MSKVFFRQKAIDDLNEIWDYTFAKWSEDQADRYYEMLKFACYEISINPIIGRKYSELNKNLYGLKSGKHIVFYQIISKEEVEIIRILHERMDLKNRLTV